MSVILRFAPLVLVLALAVTAVLLGWNDYLSLDTIRDHGGGLRAFTARHMILAMLIYLLAYAAVTTTAIPGAVFLTLTGGFLFGTWTGGVLTSLGATIGAVGVHFVVRRAIGGWLREKAARDRGLMQRICAGIDRNCFRYVLLVRLIPSVPFILINIAAGLVAAPLRPYALATFLGILPVTLIYSRIGAGLGELLARDDNVTVADLVRGFFWPLAGVAFLALILPLLLRLFRRTEPTAPV